MPTEDPSIPLPKHCSTHFRSAILHVISLAQYATAYARGWTANSINTLLRAMAFDAG